MSELTLDFIWNLLYKNPAFDGEISTETFTLKKRTLHHGDRLYHLYVDENKEVVAITDDCDFIQPTILEGANLYYLENRHCDPSACIRGWRAAGVEFIRMRAAYFCTSNSSYFGAHAAIVYRNLSKRGYNFDEVCGRNIMILGGVRKYPTPEILAHMRSTRISYKNPDALNMRVMEYGI